MALYRRRRLPLIGLPVIGFVTVLFVLPVAWLSLLSFRSGLGSDASFTVANYLRFVESGFYWRALGASLLLASVVTAATFLLGFPVAYYMYSCSPRVRKLILVAIISPLLVSVVVRAFGWLLVLGHNGLVNDLLARLRLIDEPLRMTNSYFAVTIGFVHVLLPFMILPIAAVLEKIEPSVLEASRSLGARPWQRLVRVVLPLSAPGIGAGAVIVFALTVGAYATPLVLGGGRVNNLALLIYRSAESMAPQYPFSGAMSVVLVATTLALLVVYLRRVEMRSWRAER
jgi:putative spermidine/putrescine transport system permease protein